MEILSDDNNYDAIEKSRNELIQNFIYSKDLDAQEVERHKKRVAELTSIRIIYEPENNKGGLSFKQNHDSNINKIKDLFKNHVIK